jgi:hypothetical protein
MCRLSSSKVRLALIVNGLYFISLLTPATPPTRPYLFARWGEGRGVRVSTKTPPSYAPPAPPSKATVNYFKEFDQLDVFLTSDLGLVRKPEHTLLLSPTFTTRMSAPEHPRSILMRFISFSNEQVYTDSTPLMISADGVYKWDDTADNGANLLRANNGRHSVTFEGGRVVETVGVELPYETFFEIISARRVVIQLGRDTVELNADQIEALRDMHRRLPHQSDYLWTPPAAKTGRPSTVSAEPRIYRAAPDTQPLVKGQ